MRKILFRFSIHKEHRRKETNKQTNIHTINFSQQHLNIVLTLQINFRPRSFLHVTCEGVYLIFGRVEVEMFWGKTAEMFLAPSTW